MSKNIICELTLEQREKFQEYVYILLKNNDITTFNELMNEVYNSIKYEFSEVETEEGKRNHALLYVRLLLIFVSNLIIKANLSLFDNLIRKRQEDPFFSQNIMIESAKKIVDFQDYKKHSNNDLLIELGVLLKNGLGEYSFKSEFLSVFNRVDTLEEEYKDTYEKDRIKINEKTLTDEEKGNALTAVYNIFNEKKKQLSFFYGFLLYKLKQITKNNFEINNGLFKVFRSVSKNKGNTEFETHVKAVNETLKLADTRAKKESILKQNFKYNSKSKSFYIGKVTDGKGDREIVSKTDTFYKLQTLHNPNETLYSLNKGETVFFFLLNLRNSYYYSESRNKVVPIEEIIEGNNVNENEFKSVFGLNATKEDMTDFYNYINLIKKLDGSTDPDSVFKENVSLNFRTKKVDLDVSKKNNPVSLLYFVRSEKTVRNGLIEENPHILVFVDNKYLEDEDKVTFFRVYYDDKNNPTLKLANEDDITDAQRNRIINDVNGDKEKYVNNRYVLYNYFENQHRFILLSQRLIEDTDTNENISMYEMLLDIVSEKIDLNVFNDKYFIASKLSLGNTVQIKIKNEKQKNNKIEIDPSKLNKPETIHLEVTVTSLDKGGIYLNNTYQIEIKKEDIISAFEEYKKGKTIGAYEFSVNNFLRRRVTERIQNDQRVAFGDESIIKHNVLYSKYTANDKDRKLETDEFLTKNLDKVFVVNYLVDLYGLELTLDIKGSDGITYTNTNLVARSIGVQELKVLKTDDQIETKAKIDVIKTKYEIKKPKDSNKYIIDGVEYIRVTQLENKEKLVNINQNIVLGQLVDEAFKNAIENNGEIEFNILNDNDLKNKLTNSDDRNLYNLLAQKAEYESESLKNKLQNHYNSFLDEISKQDFKIIGSDITVFGQIGIQNIAGTMDILLSKEINGKTHYMVVDLKTSKIDDIAGTEEYVNQVSFYKELLHQTLLREGHSVDLENISVALFRVLVNANSNILQIKDKQSSDNSLTVINESKNIEDLKMVVLKALTSTKTSLDLNINEDDEEIESNFVKVKKYIGELYENGEIDEMLLYYNTIKDDLSETENEEVKNILIKYGITFEIRTQNRNIKKPKFLSLNASDINRLIKEFKNKC